MIAFYDQMLPSFVKKYTKKWGAEVGEVTMPALEENNTMHAVNVTDSMRESVMQGQPRFSLSAYNGDIDVIFDETQKIASTYKLPMDIVVAKNSKDYVSAMIAHGVSEDKVVIESAAVYLDWEDIIIVNAENIYNRLHYVSVLSHENMHSVTRNNKEAVYAVAKKLPIMQVLKFAESELGYSLDYIKKNLKDVSFEVTDEIISTFVETIAVMPVNTGGDVFYRYLTGSLTIDEAMEACELGIANMYNGEYKAITDAAKPLLRDNLTILKDERYKAKRVGNALIWGEGGTSNERGGANNEASDEKFSTELQSSQGDESGTSGGGTREDAQEVTRYSLPDPDPSDVFFDEIPIFDEQGNEIDFNSLTPEEAKEVLDGKVRQMLEAEYDHAVVSIRKEAEEARQAVKEVYRAEKEKRRKGAKAARTNAARIDVIFGDTPFESLPYEVQALILIATGQAKIYWGDRGNKRGLASELGLTGSTGDRHAYRNIWGGAKKSFDEVVHEWWESLGGHENGIDTQDLRNALISALQSVQSSRDAMQEIINKYDDLATDRDNALAEVDRNEEKELHEAKSAYEQHLANFELAEGEERTAYHDRAAQFFGNQSLSRVDDILEDLTNELERSKRKIERLKAEKKDVYTPLAESIQHAKDTVLRALERLRMFAGMEEVDLNDVARLINLVKASRSQRQIEELGAEATALVQRISIKKAKTNLMRLLSLKLSNTDIIHKMLKESDTWTKEEREAILKHLWKVSRNGLRVSEAIHPDAKAIIIELNGLVERYKAGDDVERAKIIEEMRDWINPNADEVDMQRKYKDYAEKNKRAAYHLLNAYMNVLDAEVAYEIATAKYRGRVKSKAENSAIEEAREDMRVKTGEYLNELTLFNKELEGLMVKGMRVWVQDGRHGQA